MEYTVSIIIPTHNRAHLLPIAIHSCLNQSYPIAEIIIIDDASTDNTKEILSNLCEKYPIIKAIYLTENKGAQAARIEGIKQATGRLLAFLDSDDELLPNSVAVRVKALQNSKFSEALVFGYLENFPVSLQNNRALNGFEYAYLLKEQVVCSYITLLINRSCFDKTGFPSPYFPACQDDDMVLTICKYFPIIHCQKVVARISEQENSISYNRYNLYKGHKLLLKKYKQDMIKYCGRSIYILWKIRLWSQYLLYQMQQNANKKSFSFFVKKIMVFSIRKFMSLFFDKYYI